MNMSALETISSEIEKSGMYETNIVLPQRQKFENYASIRFRQNVLLQILIF